MMNTSNIRSRVGHHLAMVAAMTMTGGCWGAAGAPTVHGGSTDAMAAWYGRAGGLTMAHEVSQPEAMDKRGPPVKVSYNAVVASWTNMPRGQEHEGPVTSTAASDFSEHWYGRAGGLTGSDRVAATRPPSTADKRK